MARVNSGRPGEPPGLCGKAAILQPVAGERGVRHHDAVDAMRLDHAHNVGKIGIGDVGCELDQERRALLHCAPRHLHPREQRSESFRCLQIAQAWRVGRGDVDGEIVGNRAHAADARHVIADTILAVLAGADIHPDHAVAASRETAKRGRLALIVEAEAVDDGAVGGGAKNAWGGIALLRLRRQRADFDEAEPRGEKRREHPRILVEASRHADRIAEVHTPQSLRKPRIVGRSGAGIKPELKALDGEVMRTLRIERVQQRLAKAVQRVHGATP